MSNRLPLLFAALAQPCGALRIHPGGLVPAFSVGDVLVGACPQPDYVDAAAAHRPLACAEGDAAWTDGVAFPTVQGAVDVAADGGVVLVCPGVHAEAVRVDGRRLEITSADGDPASTVIDGGDDRALDVTTSTVTVSDLALTGTARHGGAVRAVGAQLHLLRAVVRDGWADADGGGLRAERSTVHLDGVTVSGNEAGYSGGGLAFVDTCAEIRDSALVGNYADYAGGGIDWLSASGAPMLGLWDVALTDNFAGYSGGGIAFSGYAGDEVLGISGGSFTENRAGYAGGAVEAGAQQRADVFVTGVTFASNEADHSGGALATGGHGATLVTVGGASFTDNHAGATGGAIAHDGWARDIVTVGASTFTGNDAPAGAAMWVAGYEPITFTLDQATFVGNLSAANPDPGTIVHQQGVVHGQGVDFVDRGLVHLACACGSFSFDLDAAFTCDDGDWSVP